MTYVPDRWGGQATPDPGVKRPSGEMEVVNRALAIHQAVRLVEVAHDQALNALVMLAEQSIEFREVARRVTELHASLWKQEHEPDVCQYECDVDWAGLPGPGNGNVGEAP